MDVSLWLCLPLGVLVGFLAGLFGIGGGALLVPCLSYLFVFQGLAQDVALHTAWATAMASIVVTSIMSMWKHHQRGGVVWSIWRMMLPSVVVGTLIGAYVVTQLHAAWMATMFALFMVYVAGTMAWDVQPQHRGRRWHSAGFSMVGMGIGSLSALFSIGGGTMTVPFLTWQQVPMRQAVGTSAALGVPIACLASLMYMLAPSSQAAEGATGWVVWQVVLLVSLGSVWTVGYGASWAHKLQGATLKRWFAVLLLLLAGQMLGMLV